MVAFSGELVATDLRATSVTAIAAAAPDRGANAKAAFSIPLLGVSLTLRRRPAPPRNLVRALI